MTQETILVPLPGNAHPAFDEAEVDQFLQRPIGTDGLIKIMEPDGRVAVFRSAQIVIPFGWIVWLDEQSRGIAQVAGRFNYPTFEDHFLRDAPVFARGAHIAMPVQEGPPQ